MSSTDSVETTAATIDQAVNQALAQLGADQDDVTIEVLSTPRAGVLGLGARQARVRVTRRAPVVASSGVTSPPPAPPMASPPRRPTPVASPPAAAPVAAAPVAAAPVAAAPPPTVAPEPEETQDELAEPPALTGQEPAPHGEVAAEDLAREASSVLARILELMGEKAEIETVHDSTAENIELNVKGDGSGLLIGRHGQTLDALEYIVNRIVARQLKDAPPVSVDTESYRARRRRQLHRMALAKGEQAKREHVAVELDPMPPRDRRIIHLALRDDPLITTRSTGEGFLRSIQIVPVEERREGGGGRRRERNRERAGERANGQQGGFKHGQKRIV